MSRQCFPELVGGMRDGATVPKMDPSAWRIDVPILSNPAVFIADARGHMERIFPGPRVERYTRRRIAFGGSDTMLDVWVEEGVPENDLSFVWERLLDLAGCRWVG
jgi:hypothetical protein